MTGDLLHTVVTAQTVIPSSYFPSVNCSSALHTGTMLESL